MKRVLIICSSFYIAILIAISVFSLIGNAPNYFTYKRKVQSIETKLTTSVSKTEETAENSVDGQKDQDKAESPKDGTVSDTGNTDYSGVQFRHNLKKGDTGEDVKKLQYLLKQKNLYPGEINGSFDDTTEEAVKKFQAQSGLLDDGQAGVATQAKLVE